MHNKHANLRMPIPKKDKHNQAQDQRSTIKLNIANLSLIREICALSLSKYWFKFGRPNNLYTKPDKMNITPAKNKDGIVMTCITQYLRSWNISINGRSPVLIILRSWYHMLCANNSQPNTACNWIYLIIFNIRCTEHSRFEYSLH
jgi:hypothetical protein